MAGSERSLSLHLVHSKQAEGRHGYGFREWLWIEGTATFALDFPQSNSSVEFQKQSGPKGFLTSQLRQGDIYLGSEDPNASNE